MGKKKSNETALQIYVHEKFGEIRTAGTWDNPLFCLADVCRALKLDSSAVMRRLEDGVISSHPITDSLGRTQKANFVNEDGLYEVVLDSRKPEAKKFRKWITGEVLPSIRKTGMYVNPNFDNERWAKTREGTKDAAKVMSAAIKIFIDYARAQGCDWEEKHYYSQAHLWCNAGAGLPKKDGRDTSSVQQLNNIDLLNRNIVTNVLFNGMADGLHYTQIWARIPQRINAFLEITFQTPKLIGE